MVVKAQEAVRQGSIRLVRGCPCYKVFGDEKLCVNNDSVLEIGVIDIDPTVFGYHHEKEAIEQERAPENDVCYCAIYVNYPDNKVYCISQGWVIRIHGKDVPGSDLEDALQFLSTKDLSANAEICSECLYKFLLTLSDVFADLMTRKEKTDEIKRYVDKFSLKIAVKLSQMDDLMKPIGTEDQIEQGVQYFAFLRGYLIQLLEQQGYWSNLGRELQENHAEPWVMELVGKRERLARLEFQFYSQTLQIRDINDFHLLIKMLNYILRTSDEILALNEKIHDEIRSQRFKELADKDQRFSYLKAYAEKSRTVEHNFGNILQILSRL